MRFRTIFASGLAFTASALAQILTPSPTFSSIYFPRSGEAVVAGTLYHIEWNADGAVGPATLYLLGGDDAATLQVLATIAHVDVNNAEYRWAVDCSLGGKNNYVIQISWDGDNGKTFGISPIFYIQGPNCYSAYSVGPSSYPSRPTSYLSRPVTSYPSEPTGYPSEPSGYPTESATPIASSAFAETSGSAADTTVTDSSIVVVTPSISPTGRLGNSTTPLATPIPTAGATKTSARLGLGLLVGAFVLYAYT